MEENKKEKKPTIRRDKLIELEQQAQKLWEEKDFFKCTPDSNKKKFFSTFPYPYMNGKLHLGHAFSLSKNEFANRYKKLQGYNILFSQSFHCTGMPISAAAMRIKNELEKYGNPPVFPPLKDGKGKQIVIEQKQQRTLFQYEIMERMGMQHDQVVQFVDPLKWLTFFPPLGKEDLIKFGLHSDWRRSFITTSANPYYNNFIEWQFTKLKEENKICFGKRPSIYSVIDQQICADHERAEGEGVNPQEYSLIKLLIKEPLPEAIKEMAGRKVYLVAATLRPETMYGQTNCFLLPDGIYGAFEMKNQEIYICSERSALNMAYQDMTAKFGQIFKIKDIEGKQLLGAALKAPLTPLETVYALPMLSISMRKGTGVVTSVPTDAPDDFATLRDLQKKPELREKYGIKEYMVDVKPIEIIEIPGYGRNAAEKVCEEFKVKSQNDKELLRLAKEKVYLEGFYKGILVVKEFEGMKVQDAKPKVKKMMIENNQADIYYEPESLVISRSRDECVVALCDQWYLNYADPEWKKLLYTHTKDQNKFWCYTKQATNEINFTVNWLHEWGCSRNFGLGTKLPWDKSCLIESLSDSTIYMAYYTISHYLQGKYDGSQPGLLNIKPDDISLTDWDYIFLNKPYDASSKIPEASLKQMQNEFNYWYPMDLRCSGKDLIKNHLTMCLFNHCAIWKDFPEKWPRKFFCNGWILVNGEKMSKSMGNFYTIADACQEFGADATRIALAQAGDGLEDANFTIENAQVAILRLSTLEMYLRDSCKRVESYRNADVVVPDSINFFDKVFENSMKQNYLLTIEAYENMKFRDVIKYGFDEFQSIKDQYKINVGASEIRKDLFLQYIELQLLIMAPIVPHFTEIIYNELAYPLLKAVKPNVPEFISFHQFPTIDQKEIDLLLLMKNANLYNFLHEARLTQKKLMKHQKPAKGKTDEKKEPEIQKLNVFIAKEYLPWQKTALQILQGCQYEEDMKTIKDDWRTIFKQSESIKKEDLKKSFQFGQAALDDVKTVGKQALQFQLPFNELEFLESQREYIIRELKISELKITAVEDVKADNKELITMVASAKPGKPGFQLLF